MLKDGWSMGRRKTVSALLAMTILVIKMVVLEKFSIGQPPFQFVIVASIVPLAILFGVIGIVGMSIGCAIAHSVNYIGLVDVLGAGSSVLLGCGLAYKFVQKKRFPATFFLGNLIITASMTVIMGTGRAYMFNLSVEAGMLSVFTSLWIGLNVIGYLLQEALRRLLTYYQVIDPL